MTYRHIEVDPNTNGNLFFWHYQNRHIANKQRTVLWLNGGPGCSSMDGALMEVGPYRLKDDQTLEMNNGSWDEFANLLFVDQPVGTGFSYANTDSYLHELDEMAAHFMIFLEKFFGLFPEYEKDDVGLPFTVVLLQGFPFLTNGSSTWRVNPMLDSTSLILPRPSRTATRMSRKMEERNGHCGGCLSEMAGSRPRTNIRHISTTLPETVW